MAIILLETLRPGLHLSSEANERHHLQPKRLALLVYLAMAPLPEPCSRDTLIALLWPELADKAARRALRQAVHYLRSELGGNLIIGEGSDRIGLDAGRLACDAVEFDRFLDEDHPAQALQLYRGDFLAGFYFQQETAPFERWVEHERTRLRQRALGATADLSLKEERRGNLPGAAYWAQRALDLDPFGETDLRRLVELLWQMGDRAAAMDAFHTFAQRLAKEYDVSVAPETRRLVRAIETGRNGTSKEISRAGDQDAFRRFGKEFERSMRLLRDLSSLAGPR